jgi:hypothetical protein
MADFLRFFTLTVAVPIGLWIGLGISLLLVGLIYGGVVFFPGWRLLSLLRKIGRKKGGLLATISVFNLWFLSFPFLFFAALIWKLFSFIRNFSDFNVAHSNRFGSFVTLKVPIRFEWMTNEESRPLSLLTITRNATFPFFPTKGLLISFKGLGLNGFGQVSESNLQGKIESVLYHFDDQFLAAIHKVPHFYNEECPPWAIQLRADTERQFFSEESASTWIRELFASGWEIDLMGYREREFSATEWDWLCNEGRKTWEKWTKSGKDIDQFLQPEKFRESA